MIQEINRAGKYTGCLLGLALGDALGTTLDFKKRGSYEALTDISGGGPYELEAGEWTANTSMAMCLTDSLIHCRFDASDQMSRYLEWHEHGYWSARDFCFGISDEVRNAILNFKQDESKALSEASNPDSKSSVPLTRVAPIPLFYVKYPEKALDRIINSTETTHSSKVCKDACTHLTHLIIGALLDEDKESILSEDYSCIKDSNPRNEYCDEMQDIMSTKFKEKPEFYIESKDNVIDTLEAALWAFHNSNNFKEGALLAANLGENSSAISSVYGQLAGAFYGIDGLPDNWIRKLAFRDNIQDTAEKLWLESLK